MVVGQLIGDDQLRREQAGLGAADGVAPGIQAVAGHLARVGLILVARSKFEPGDAVFGSGSGAFAEYAAAPEEKLLPKPDELSFEQASALQVMLP